MDPARKYWHKERGFNYRMTNIQAAIGVAQLEQIDKFIERREQLLQLYRQFVKTSDDVRLNYQANWAKCAHWMVCLEIDWLNEAKRARLMSGLHGRGIDSRPYFYPDLGHGHLSRGADARRHAQGCNRHKLADLLRIGARRR